MCLRLGLTALPKPTSWIFLWWEGKEGKRERKGKKWQGTRMGGYGRMGEVGATTGKAALWG